jgi:hypothetical protein
MEHYRPLETLNIYNYQLVPEEWKRTKECVECGTRYRELENIGRLHCRIHPGERLYNLEANCYYFSCCFSTGGRGCLKSDHHEFPIGGEDETLLDFSTRTVATILYEYGLVPPLSSQIIYHSEEGKREISYRHTLLPEEKTLSIEGIKAGLAEAAKSSALFSKLRDTEMSRRMESMKQFDIKWKSNLEDGGDDEDADGVGNEFDIPFIVIARLGPAL